jgi:alkanesulfonate monooxygenase SsuD/methylene tetrahydromethanopterin reductase-like flavin-dependent oxidoreductase (luciferase family)
MELLIDAFVGDDIADTASRAKALEAAGYDGILAPRRGTTPSCRCSRPPWPPSGWPPGCSVAIAFARSPMTMAASAYDLAGYSEGRFILGLGSQVKPPQPVRELVCHRPQIAGISLSHRH